MASSNAMFLAPREVEEQYFFSPIPEPLPNWPAPPAPAPSYKHIFIVRIDCANPATQRVTVRRIPLGSVQDQSQLDQTHLQLGDDKQHDFPGANSGKNLNLKFKTSQEALVIFHMVDPEARFVEADANGHPTHGVVKAKGDPDLLFQPRWIKGSNTDREALSVILKGLPKGQKLDQQYGLGVQLKNDDGQDSWTSIIIDPKVENEGDGGGGMPATPHLQSPSAS